VWVLDTATKGTGASVVPLEQAAPKPGAKKDPPAYQPPKPRPARPKPPPAPAPRQPRRFKVVDVVSGATLAEEADTRATLEVLRGLRSVVDVRVSVWDPRAADWRLLSLGEQRVLWDARHAESRPG
jgi:hypothetical protein